MPRVHELCAEALARLGDADAVRSAWLRAQLVATSNPFGPDRVELGEDPDLNDPGGVLLADVLDTPNGSTPPISASGWC